MKLGVALLLARLAWRFVRAHTAARAGRRVLAAVGKDAAPLPRLRLDLSPRLWPLAFLTTSTFYLVQTDTEQAASGRWPLFAPWLHTSALPVFAVLAVLVALAWSAVASLAARVRALRARTPAPAPTGFGTAQVDCRASRTRGRPRSRRESSSASRSRAARRPSPRSPRTAPRARGTVSSRPGEVE